MVAGVAFCYMLTYYATQGRGYQWQEICAVTGMCGCWWYYFAPANYAKEGIWVVHCFIRCRVLFKSFVCLSLSRAYVGGRISLFNAMEAAIHLCHLRAL